MFTNPLLGNDELFNSIACLAGRDMLPHAALILGERGSGRYTLAKTIAAMAVCGSTPPCGECNDCRLALGGRHPDVSVFSKDTENTLTIKSLRRINAEVAVPPNQGRRRVVILRDIQDAAQLRTLNTLLKVIEEPPPYLMFIITATSREAVLDTIVSRCQPFFTRLPGVEDCIGAVGARLLELESPAAPKDELLLAAMAARGNIGRCLEFLSDSAQGKAYRCAASLCAAIKEGDRYGVLKLLYPFERDRTGFRLLLDTLASVLGAEILGGKQTKLVNALEAVITEAERSMYNLNLPLTLTLFAAGLCGG